MKLTTKGLIAAEEGARIVYDHGPGNNVSIELTLSNALDPDSVLDNCRIIQELINPDIGEDESGVSSMPEVFTIEELKSKWAEVDISGGEPYDIDEMVAKLIEQELIEA